MTRKPGTNRVIAILIFLIVFAAGAALCPSIGPAWDEPDNIVSGGVYWNFLTGRDPTVLESTDKSASRFMNTIFTQEPSLARYPPVPNFVGTALVAASEKIGFPATNKNIIIAFHLATVLFFALLVACMYQWGILLGFSRLTALFAAGATFLYPTLFGHGLSNLKDTAQVSLFIVSLYYLVCFSTENKGMYRSLKEFRGWKNLVLGAIVWGLGLATKINAIYVPILWFMWVFLSSEWFIEMIRRPQRIMNHELGIMARRKQLFMILYSLFILLAVGFATAIAAWPYLWFDPAGRIAEVVRYFTTVGEGFRIFWNGNLLQVGVGRSLWWYPWANLGIVTPVPLLLLMGIGVIGVITRLRQGYGGQGGGQEGFGGQREIGRKPERTILLLWLTVPMMRAMLPNAAFYDGIRHFMETIPAVVLLAGVGLEGLGRLGKYGNIGKYAAVIVAVSVTLQLLVINATYFPYSTGYYNALAGDANRKFDRDIEGLSIKEGVEYLHATYGSIRLWAPIAGHLSWYYVRAGDLYVYNTTDADSIILINKSSHATNDEFYPAIADQYRLDHVITRGGAVFAWIYRKK